METQEDAKKYQVIKLADIEAVDCPCGASRRAFTDDPDQVLSLHVVDIKCDAALHYHKKLTEVYYFLEGEGHMELDGEAVPVGPGSAVLIKPGCRHRALGELKVLVIPVPAFDPSDEWFD
jgi:mannose-6-phosphate isomerase-like protein (cupin superfamily)